MTDTFPKPLGRDDQPTDAADEILGELPPDEADIARLTAVQGTDDADSELLPSVVEFDDHERFDVDDPAKPGIDDYTD